MKTYETDVEAFLKVRESLDKKYDTMNSENIVNIATDRLESEYKDFTCLKCQAILRRQSNVGKLLHNIAHIDDKYIIINSDKETILTVDQLETLLDPDYQQEEIRVLLDYVSALELNVKKVRELIPDEFINKDILGILEAKNKSLKDFILNHKNDVLENLDFFNDNLSKSVKIAQYSILEAYFKINDYQDIDDYILSIMDHDFNKYNVCKDCAYDKR